MDKETKAILQRIVELMEITDYQKEIKAILHRIIELIEITNCQLEEIIRAEGEIPDRDITYDAVLKEGFYQTNSEKE